MNINKYLPRWIFLLSNRGLFTSFVSLALISILVSVLYISISFAQTTQKYTVAEVKAAYIYSFAAKYITWENEKNIQEFKIGVFGRDFNVYFELKKLCISRKLKGKPIVVYRFKELKNIEKTQVLYISSESNFEFAQILKKVKGNNTLIITTNCEIEKSMINFVYNDTKKSFEVNEKNIFDENLTISPKLAEFAKSKINWQALYKESGKKLLESEKEKVKFKDEIIAKQKILDEKMEILNKQEKEIKKQQEEIKIQSNILNNQKNDIQAQQNKIEEQKVILDKQLLEIRTRDLVLYLFFALFILIISLAFFIYRGYKIKKQINKQLEEKNIELEKLSIVARETDNSVVIANADGEIEWVNEGFSRLMGYTYEEFLQEKGSNLIKASGNPDIKNVIKECIEQKKSVIYSASNKTKYGENIWVQTTLTPIVDSNGKLTKLVAIDSNITKIKKAEQEIRQQQKELVKAFKQSSKQQVEIHKALMQINKQKEEITDSIQYASRIQTAILPPDKFINEILPENFIIYKPRDIVSGDFYIVSEKNGKIVIAVADCTGHGVPGAFMSMLGISFLNEIVNKAEDIQSDDVLNQLREYVTTSLHQTSKIGGSKDGMDIALCILDTTTNKLQFSGANNSLYLIFSSKGGLNDRINDFKKYSIIHSFNHSLIEIKADRMPIGIYVEKVQPFTSNELQLQKGDTLYIFTDGYVDQFGGEKGKKFKTRRLKQLLLNNQDNDMAKQQAILEKTINDWQGKLEQVDDILVMGIRI